MKKIDVNELRRLTAEAVKKGEEKAALDARHAKDKEERRLRAVERKAACIIEGIPDRAEKEASVGRNHAIVMGVKYDDFIKPSYSNNETPANLKDAAKLVWQHCVDAGLNPTLEYWHDGVGIQGGHNIVIHW